MERDVLYRSIVAIRGVLGAPKKIDLIGAEKDAGEGCGWVVDLRRTTG